MENSVVVVNSSSGSGNAIIRQVDNLEMIEVALQGLSTNTAYIGFFENDQVSVPAIRFVSGAQGRGSALAFTKFFDFFSLVAVAPE